MDLDLSEQQEMLRSMARDFLKEECPVSFVRDMEADDKGYSPELWKKMAELGWTGLIIPEEYGGMESTFLDLSILLEEMGRVVLPSPFIPTVVYSSMPIVRYGTSEQKKSFLPKIAQGELIMTLAFLEPSCSFDEQGIQSTADRENDIYNINGTKLFVPDAHVANYLLCPARAKEGVTLFLVDATNPRIKCTLLKTITSDKQCEVIFDKVGVPRGNVLGEVGNGWQIVEKIKEWGAIAQCSFVFGGVQRVLELTVSYAKERIQFGKPIGSFQRVQNHCTDMAMDIEGIKWLTYEAAWRLSEGLPAAKEISMAKAWASDASRRIGVNAHRVHAGIGLFTDYDIELYFRRAKAMELAFGDGDFHREIVAKELGLC